MHEAWSRLNTLIGDMFDILVVAIGLIVLLVFFQPGVQRSWSYAAAALAAGAVFGYTARQAPFIPEWAVVLAIALGIITGPVTIATLRGKTIFEAVDDIRRSRREGNPDE
tara:strand:+ start:284 stop:613 length:330 start_codon:yes stop_codon:yes gene_type:complete